MSVFFHFSLQIWVHKSPYVFRYFSTLQRNSSRSTNGAPLSIPPNSPRMTPQRTPSVLLKKRSCSKLPVSSTAVGLVQVGVLSYCCKQKSLKMRQVVFSDYFSCILGLVRQGSSWSLNPFGVNILLSDAYIEI